MNSQLEAFTKKKIGDEVVHLKDACKNNGEFSEPFPTGFDAIDNALKIGDCNCGGVREGDLIIVTGKSGDGKTSFCQNITYQALQKGFPTLWFSYEIEMDNLYARFKIMGIGDRSAVYSPKKLLTGRVDWVEEKIKEAIEKYMVKIVIVDHLDFLSPADSNNTDQYRMRLRNICQQLKLIALNNSVIIVLMAHIKKVQARDIEMEDIAESAGIYQLSDLVLLVKRKENTTPALTMVSKEGSVKILKNRLTGELIEMNFIYEKSIIKPIY